METLLWLLILAFVFGTGYYLVKKIEHFVRGNPSAFPGNRKILVPPRPDSRSPWEDDKTCHPWYNDDDTNRKELDRHEACDP